MGVVCTEMINAPADLVWDLVTDIDGAVELITSITNVEVLNRPENGSLLDLEWEETRNINGREYVETIRVSGVEHGDWVEMRGKSFGMEYESRFSLMKIESEMTQITYVFNPQPRKWYTRIMGFFITPILSKAIKNCIAQDFADIKTAALRNNIA